MADPEEKPNINAEASAPAAEGKLNLRVRSQDGQQVTFQAKPTTRLSKLMRAYCERQVVDYQSVVFSYDGQRLREDQTPGELEMEDNDYIDVLQHQVRPLKARTTQSNDNYVKKVARSLVELLSLRNEVQVGGM